MKRFGFFSIIAVMLILLSACGQDSGPHGTYTVSDKTTDLTVILDGGYCLIDVLNEQDGKVASAAVGGKYTVDDEVVIIEIEEGELDGDRFEFLYNESCDTLTNTTDDTVCTKVNAADAKPDGIYSYEKGQESYVLEINDSSCVLRARSVNEKGEVAEGEESGVVSTDGNVVEIKMDNKNYRFIYASGANVLMDTSDGRMYKAESEFAEE